MIVSKNMFDSELPVMDEAKEDGHFIKLTDQTQLHVPISGCVPSYIHVRRVKQKWFTCHCHCSNNMSLQFLRPCWPIVTKANLNSLRIYRVKDTLESGFV